MSLTQPLTRPLTTALSRAITSPGVGGGAAPAWNPSDWYAAGEQGFALYPTINFAGLYQDSAGATPITAVEELVGKHNDKSGRGNNATQATSAARPVLSARHNAILASEDLSAVAWGLMGVQPFGSGSIINVGASGIATADFIAEDSSTAVHGVQQSPASGSDSVSIQCKIKAGTRGFAMLTAFSGAANINVAVNLTTAAVSAIDDQYGSFTNTTVSAALLPSGFVLLRLSGRRAGIAIDSVRLTIAQSLTTAYGGQSYAGDGTSGIYVAEFDVEPSLAARTYQRVTTATNYDTSFPLYEGTDGVDDSQATAAGGGASTYAAIVMAFRTSSVGSAQTLFSDRSGNTGLKLEITAGGNIALSGGNGGSINTATGAAVTAGTDYVVTAIYDGASLSVQLNNGAATTAACALSAGTAAVSLGKDNGAATGFFLGRRYGMLYAKDAAKSAGDIASAKTYIGALAGITL